MKRAIKKSIDMESIDSLSEGTRCELVIVARAFRRCYNSGGDR